MGPFISTLMDMHRYRDLKLENVLVASDGHLKLGDFGLAKKVEAGRGASKAGTELAMAPEMLNGEVYDYAVDWWALGILFCDMLMGGSPIPVVGRDVTLVDLVQIFKDGRHLDRLSTRLDAGTRGAITGLLTVDPSARVHHLAMLKELPLYNGFGWDALLAGQMAAPLQAYMSPDIPFGGGGSAGGGGRLPSGEVADVEKRFTTFIKLPAVDGSEAGGFATGSVDLSSTALCDAAARGDVAVLQAIADAGGDVNLGDYDRRTAMHLAASEGLLEVVTYLVEQLSANHSPLDRWGGTPLDDALRHRHTAVADYLQSKGAAKQSIGANGVDVSSTALCHAAANGNVAALQAIADAGGDVNLGDYDRRTAIHLAASEGMEAAADLLINLGTYPRMQPMSTCTFTRALTRPRGQGLVGPRAHAPMRARCAGADINQVDRWGGRPLDDASRHGHTAVIELLQQHGAKPGSTADLSTHHGDSLAGRFQIRWRSKSKSLSGHGNGGWLPPLGLVSMRKLKPKSEN